jgi:hypothetical protein
MKMVKYRLSNDLKTTLLVVSLSIFYLVITISVAYSQPTSFSQYSSNYLDMGIKYPNDWVYQEYTGNIFSTDDYATIFVPPSEVSFLSNSSASTPNVTIQISKQRDLPYKNMPLDLYLDYVKKLQISQGNNVTNATKTNLSDGTPAYQIDVLNENLNSKMVLVVMNKSPESYYFLYKATPDKFNTYLPIAQQMFKTLSFK